MPGFEKIAFFSEQILNTKLINKPNNIKKKFLVLLIKKNIGKKYYIIKKIITIHIIVNCIVCVFERPFINNNFHENVTRNQGYILCKIQ